MTNLDARPVAEGWENGEVGLRDMVWGWPTDLFNSRGARVGFSCDLPAARPRMRQVERRRINADRQGAGVTADNSIAGEVFLGWNQVVGC